MQLNCRKTTRPLAETEDSEDSLMIDNDVNVGASTSTDADSTYVDYDAPSTSKGTSKVPKWFKPTK